MLSAIISSFREAVAFGGSAAFVFYWLEKTASKNVKSLASDWIRNVQIDNASYRSIAGEKAIFKATFGEQAFSVRSFASTMSWTAISFIIASVVFVLAGKGQYLYILRIVRGLLMEQGYGGLAIRILFLYGIMNVVCDFFAISLTRILLMRQSDVDPTAGVVSIFLIDLFIKIVVLTPALVLIPLVTGLELSGIYVRSDGGVDFSEYQESWKNFLSLDMSFRGLFSKYYALITVSAILSSIWIWLYVLFGLMIRKSGYIQSAILNFVWIFDVENKPFQSIGFLISILFGGGYFVFFWILKIIGFW